MAKRKTKKKAVRRAARKVEPAVFVPVPVPVEVVLVPVPIEKTKKSEWQKFVDWIMK